jgi:hypothetical protein
MNALAAAAVGFLIGKQTTNPPTATVSVPVDGGSAKATVETPAEAVVGPVGPVVRAG